jgi:hypothetical protein
MYITNRRDSCIFNGCSPLQLHLGLIGLKPAIAHICIYPSVNFLTKMKSKHFFTILSLFISISISYSQQSEFENALKLDTLSQYGSLWGNTIERIEFATELGSSLDDSMYTHMLPKSTLETNKIILTRNELDYFISMENIQILKETEAFAKPDHWAQRFDKQIQSIYFDKPLHALVIKNNKLFHLKIDSLVGIRYHTFYPFGEYELENQKMVPIVYEISHNFDQQSPCILVTSSFLKKTDLNKATVKKETIGFGSEDYPGILYKTGIDLNADGQNEILVYNEFVDDKITGEGDEGENYSYSITAMYFKNKWYRTSFWQEGQDGIEGF